MEGSFFEKLKKGMNVKEASPEEKEKEEIEEVILNLEEKKSSEESEEKPKKKKPKPNQKEEKEGELAVDVYQTKDELVIQSAIAGIKPENLDISVEDDLIIIKGKRKRPKEEEEDYFSKECYWGSFSRKIILPVEVNPGRIEATLKRGILTLRMPKISREKKRKITVKTEGS